ncbi:hypothetical protein CPAR01_03519 [Colletotrichum paranaense]|uniref:Uncharacterized protein n=1 Tax=Colletotrichum paranaense TaxID=1914294 RepID=A0ABQ9T2L0_9PEZI|nr:uncharacterized protein CPAR01_03519 [Colletotrichum paranaense]KAK1546017.1 hypothetical protein CPAR01_03519 [Colletotrichum paranaense]
MVDWQPSQPRWQHFLLVTTVMIRGRDVESAAPCPGEDHRILLSPTPSHPKALRGTWESVRIGKLDVVRIARIERVHVRSGQVL